MLMEGYFVLDGGNRVVCSLRSIIVLVCGFVVCWWRWHYTQGTKISRMDPYSNPIAAHDDLWQQVLSYWYVHGRYAELLVWPNFLNYDYSMNAVPLVLSAKDVRLFLPAMSYVTICVGIYFTMEQFHTTLGRASGFGLGLFALSFFPMSNMMFPVGTLIAERLLYIPSVGYVIVIVSFLNLLWNSLRRADLLEETEGLPQPSESLKRTILNCKRNPFLCSKQRRLSCKLFLSSVMAVTAIFYWQR